MEEIDRTNPKYKKARRKMERWLALAQSAAFVTADEDDDELAFLLSDILRENFDEFWAIKYPKR